MSELSHTDQQGRARMVDVSSKKNQARMARASGRIILKPQTVQLIRENLVKKGDVLAVAQIAGIQGGKKTSDLIPLCHPLQITKIEVNTSIEDDGITVISEARCIGQTGIEMEALTAAGIALLTIYDMCKAVDKEMIITGIQLLEKSKSDIK